MPEPKETDSARIFAEIEKPFEDAFAEHVNKSTRTTISLDQYEQVPIENLAELAAEYTDHVTHWAEMGIDIEPIIKSVLLVNTATEANLPWYTSSIEKGFEPWHEWNARWTVEERSHEAIMERLIEARGILNMSSEWLPVREQNMLAGIHPDVSTPADGIAYVATQELLTQKAHFHSARVMDESAAKNLLKIGSDEGRHYKFYVAMLRALAEVDPDYALLGMQRQHADDAFEMPGMKGIPNYKALAKTIAISGLFDPITILEAQKQTIDDAGLLKVDPETDEGKQAQEWAAGISERSDVSWERNTKVMEKLRARVARHAEDDVLMLKPFILGKTVELVRNKYQPLVA